MLRNILFDVYAIKGYHPDNPLTWGDDGGPGRPAGLPEDRIYLDIPFEEKELAKDVARRDGTFVTFDREAGRGAWWTPRYTEGLRRWPMKTWGKSAPTIHDVISLTQLKLKQLWVGVDQKSMFALENYCRATAQMLKAVKSTVQRSGTGDPVLLKEERESAADRVREAMEGFLERCTTGDEIDDLIRYESAQTLKSLLDRLENLKATGVCRSVPPPFDPDELVWRYELRAYGDGERTIFVENLLERMFQRAIARGEVDGITDVFVIDEAVRYLVDDSDHVICRLVQEARKFGIALFLISQSPTQFPEQILAGVGCKVILGLDPMFHRMAASKLGLDEKYIKAIRPRELVLVNRKLKSKVPEWVPTRLH